MSSWYTSYCNAFLFGEVIMAHSHCTGPGQGQGQGPGNDGSLYYAMYCTYYTGTGTGTETHLQFTPKMLTTISASNDSE